VPALLARLRRRGRWSSLFRRGLVLVRGGRGVHDRLVGRRRHVLVRLLCRGRGGKFRRWLGGRPRGLRGGGRRHGQVGGRGLGLVRSGQRGRFLPLRVRGGWFVRHGKDPR